MKTKTQPKIKNPFTLRRRFYNQDGTPKDWECKGTGEFTGMETVQKAIKVLKANYPGHRMDIEFIYDGEMRDFNGRVTGTVIEYR